MNTGLVATASTTIHASATAVWRALVTPTAIKEYMFGATVESDWAEGSPITWTGEWKGEPYQDKGTIQKFVPGQVLEYTHYSPLSGQPDSPENYHTVTIELTPESGATQVSLTQDNNETEEAREHSTRNWATMLAGLKQYVER